MMHGLLLGSLAVLALASPNEMPESCASATSSMIQSQSTIGEITSPETLARLYLAQKHHHVNHKESSENKQREGMSQISHHKASSAQKEHKHSAEHRHKASSHHENKEGMARTNRHKAAPTEKEHKKSAEDKDKQSAENKHSESSEQKHKVSAGDKHNKSAKHSKNKTAHHAQGKEKMSDTIKHSSGQGTDGGEDSEDAEGDEFTFADHDGSHKQEAKQIDNHSREALLDRVQKATEAAKVMEQKVGVAFKDAHAKQEAAENATAKLLEARKNATEAEEQLHHAEEELQEVVNGSSTELKSLAASYGSLRTLAAACVLGAVMLA